MTEGRLKRWVLWVAWFVCMGVTALNALFGLCVALYHVVIVLRFGSEIGANQIPVHLYTLGACLAVVGTVMMLKTDFGRAASTRWLWVTRTFLVIGFAAIAVVPGGLPPLTWMVLSWGLMLISVVLPLAFIGYAVSMSFRRPAA
jgi:hypothetical protein